MKIGIDIGGNHIAFGIIEDNIIIHQFEYEIEQYIDNNDENNIKEYIINILVDGINKIYAIRNDIEKIGISCCGTISNSVIIKSINLKIANFDLINILKSRIIDVEICLRNDAKCAALAEKKFGLLKQYNDSVFLTIGTGIGGAYVNNNELVVPVRNAGFEFGHMSIEKNGKPCRCGMNGCFERYASIKALKELVRVEFGFNKKLTGRELLEFIEINQKNTTCSEKIEKVLDIYTEYLAFGISNLINIFEPEIIVLGGSLAFYEDILLDKIIEKICIFNNEDKLPEIKMAILKNNAGILGAVL